MNGLDPMPTLTALMADPLIHAVMAADRVDPATLEASLRALAPALRRAAEPVRLGRSTCPW